MPSVRATPLACLLSLVVASSVIVGCGPLVQVGATASWPEQWQDRQLYATPNATLYASSDAAAGEADRLVASVRQTFERETDAEPTPGLIIVTDLGDAQISEDLKQLFYHATVASHRREGKPVDPEAIEQAWKTTQQSVEVTGMDVADMLRILPLPLPHELVINGLGLPDEAADEVEWIVAIPTTAVLRDGNRRIMKAMFKKQNIGIVAQAAFAPLLLALEPSTVNMLGVTRDITLFDQMVLFAPDVSPEDKKTIVQTYADRKVKEAMGPLLAAMAEHEKKDKPESQPESQPATVPASVPSN